MKGGSKMKYSKIAIMARRFLTGTRELTMIATKAERENKPLWMGLGCGMLIGILFLSIFTGGIFGILYDTLGIIALTWCYWVGVGTAFIKLSVTSVLKWYEEISTLNAIREKEDDRPTLQ